MTPNKSKKTWLIVGITGGALALCLLISCGVLVFAGPSIYSSLLARTSLSVGSTAPDFELTTLEGKSVRLSQFAGQPVLLDFGATWCPDCANADPILQQASENYPGLVVLLVDGGETRQTVQDWQKSNGYTFQVLLDSDNAIDKRYGIMAIPTIFFLDGKRVIQAKLVEAVTPELLDANLPLIGIEP